MCKLNISLYYNVIISKNSFLILTKTRGKKMSFAVSSKRQYPYMTVEGLEKAVYSESDNKKYPCMSVEAMSAHSAVTQREATPSREEDLFRIVKAVIYPMDELGCIDGKIKAEFKEKIDTKDPFRHNFKYRVLGKTTAGTEVVEVTADSRIRYNNRYAECELTYNEERSIQKKSIFKRA
jgi:hypothetical protein